LPAHGGRKNPAAWADRIFSAKKINAFSTPGIGVFNSSVEKFVEKKPFRWDKTPNLNNFLLFAPTVWQFQNHSLIARVLCDAHTF
jgi:hypothetical protein